MSRTMRAVTLLIVQAVLVLSIAAKFLYEREVCPRVWVPAAQYDPNMPLRGRYLALQLAVDACGLPLDENHRLRYEAGSSSWEWHVRPVVRGGKLVAVPASYDEKSESTNDVRLWANHPCDRATLSHGVDYFIPDTAQSPWPPKKGEELWVEVTVPTTGPPRPIQLALSKNGVFTPLNLH